MNGEHNNKARLDHPLSSYSSISSGSKNSCQNEKYFSTENQYSQHGNVNGARNTTVASATNNMDSSCNKPLLTGVKRMLYEQVMFT